MCVRREDITGGGIRVIYFAEFRSDVMVKSLPLKEKRVSSAQPHAPDTFAPVSSISLLLSLKDTRLSPKHLHCVTTLTPPNCRRTVKRGANNRSPLFPSQISILFTALSSDHNQEIHINVSGVCAQRGWSKSPNRARNYAPSGREKCSESWPSCTTARARHRSQVNKQTHSGSLEMMEIRALPGASMPAMQLGEKAILLLGDIWPYLWKARDNNRPACINRSGKDVSVWMPGKMIGS